MTGRWRRRVARCVGVALLVATAAFAAPTPASAALRRSSGAACVPGRWKLDLPALVASSTLTGTLSATGSIDINFSRTHKFLQVYADTITGTGPTVTVEIKYSGAVAATYRATARTITLSAVDNATSQIMTILVRGVSAPPQTKSPADGTVAAGSSVTLSYTCRNRTMTITNVGSVVWRLNRT